MSSVQKQIRAILATHADELKELARRIHAHPELGLEEHQACAWHTELLRARGFEVTTPFAGLETAYRAVAGSGGPTFCFMGEYDALPEIGHGCGHNLIGVAAIGAGLALAELLRATGTPGTVVVMGTPAEEGYGGKVQMIAAGALAGIDAVMLAHPSGRTGPDRGSSAITRFRIAFAGQSAHAAGAPDQARNALDGVMLTFAGINAWRQHLPEACRVHGIIDDGGAMANIIPAHASCIIYLRAMEDEILADMIRRLRAIAEGAALMTDTTAEVVAWGESYRTRIPNAPLNEAWMAAATEAGLDPVIPERPPRASSDFGDVSHQVPGVHVYFGIAENELAGHSPEFCAAAGTDFALDRMLGAAEAMAVVGHRYLTDADFRARVSEDFRTSTGAAAG